MWWTMSKIRAADREAGRHFFSPGTMRFFKSRIHSRVYQGNGGIYFVTSEQGPHGPRLFTVRRFIPEPVDIRTWPDYNGFQKFYSRGAAHNAAARAARG